MIEKAKCGGAEDAAEARLPAVLRDDELSATVSGGKTLGAGDRRRAAVPDGYIKIKKLSV